MIIDQVERVNRKNPSKKRDRGECQQERRRGKSGGDDREGRTKSERQTQPRPNFGKEFLVSRVESLHIETMQTLRSQGTHSPTSDGVKSPPLNVDRPPQR